MKSIKREKMTKRNFEEMLYKLNGGETMGHAKHIEQTEQEGVYANLHLYYNDSGHIGTWQKGGHCCYFLENLPKGETL